MDVQEHSLYRTRGGAYVAVFSRSESLFILPPHEGFQAMFLNKGTSSLKISPGTRLRYHTDGTYRVDFADRAELDLFERIGYRND